MTELGPLCAWLSAATAAALLAACAGESRGVDPARDTGGTSGNPGGGALAGSGGNASGGAGAATSGGTAPSPGSGGSGVSGGTFGAGNAGAHAGAGGSGAAAGVISAGGLINDAGGTAGASAGKGSASAGKGGDAGGGVAGTAGAGGSGAGTAGASGASAEIPPGYVKGIIGVGYGGIRILSRDGGQSWGDRAFAAANGGDDDDLLRAVAYGKGRWIATGWKLWTSDDGVDWTDHGKLHDGIIGDQQIVEGLAYKDGYFYAAGDGNPSKFYRSADGIAWTRYSEIGKTVKHTGLTFRGGLFVSYGDSHTSYQSADGLSWSEMSGLTDATYCEGTFKNFADCHQAEWFEDGFYLVPEWGGDIRRSPTGQSFKTVYSDDESNTLYRARAIAQGYVAPK
jgi:hypothetical protein